MPLPPLTRTESFSPNLRAFRRDRLTVVMGQQLSPDDLPALQGLDHPHVALFTPLIWYTMRDRMDQQWTVNDPKKKAEETLYSTTFVFHVEDQTIQQVLDLARDKDWAVYAFDEQHAFCLQLTTKMAFDIDRAHLLKHVQEL
jgi:hypothetical protein